jgi:hypothetical protein
MSVETQYHWPEPTAVVDLPSSLCVARHDAVPVLPWNVPDVPVSPPQQLAIVFFSFNDAQANDTEKAPSGPESMHAPLFVMAPPGGALQVPHVPLLIDFFPEAHVVSLSTVAIELPIGRPPGPGAPTWLVNVPLLVNVNASALATAVDASKAATEISTSFIDVSSILCPLTSRGRQHRNASEPW